MNDFLSKPFRRFVAEEIAIAACFLFLVVAGVVTVMVPELEDDTSTQLKSAQKSSKGP